jgi:hypothetical protein
LKEKAKQKAGETKGEGALDYSAFTGKISDLDALK